MLDSEESCAADAHGDLGFGAAMVGSVAGGRLSNSSFGGKETYSVNGEDCLGFVMMVLVCLEMYFHCRQSKCEM